MKPNMECWKVVVGEAHCIITYFHMFVAQQTVFVDITIFKIPFWVLSENEMHYLFKRYAKPAKAFVFIQKNDCLDINKCLD